MKVKIENCAVALLFRAEKNEVFGSDLNTVINPTHETPMIKSLSTNLVYKFSNRFIFRSRAPDFLLYSTHPLLDVTIIAQDIHKLMLLFSSSFI
jgi:hypothetical protein